MQVIEAQFASILPPHDHLHINQMNMPEPVRPDTAQTATPPARRGPRRRRSSTPDRLSRARSHLPPESVSPRARHGRPGLGAASSHPGHLRGTGPRTGNPEGSRSPATEQAGIRRPRTGLPARQQRLRDACGLSRLNDFPAL
jgi:hypothetical protein